MNLLSERLTWAIERARERGRIMVPADIARAAKVSNATLNYWLNNVNGMSAAKARLVGAYLDVNPYWLETGSGHPEIDKPDGWVSAGAPMPAIQASNRATLPEEKRQAPREQPFVKSMVRSFDNQDGVPEDVVLVPESRIEFAAGDGKINYELVEDEEPASYRRTWFQKYGINPDRVRRFRVAGDSMEPLLYARDTILVNLDETQVVDGRLYALRYGDQLRVKYLSRRLDGTLVLRSVNQAYRDEEVPAELANEHITIIGRVRDRSGTGGL